MTSTGRPVKLVSCAVTHPQATKLKSKESVYNSAPIVLLDEARAEA